MTALVVASLAVAVVAGCSSSDSDKGGGSSGSSSGGSSTADLAAAKTMVDQYLKPMTFPNLPKLSAKPPTGKKVALVFNSQATSKVFLTGAQNAAKALGWDATTITYDTTTPNGLLQAMDQALSENPDGVVTIANSVASYAQSAKAMTSKNIPLVTSNTADEVAAPIIANTQDPRAAEQIRRIAAAWIVNESGGKASTLLVDIPEFTTTAKGTIAGKEEFAKLCPACSVSVVAVKSADLGGGLPGIIVSELQRKPDINYVVLPYGDAATGVRAALDGAGFKDVKIVGASPSQSNLEAIASGDQVWVSANMASVGWRDIDALARHFLGDDVAISTEAPASFEILTKDTLPNPPAIPDIPNYESKFRALWNLG